MLKAPQPLLMACGEALVYPVSGGNSINPYIASKGMRSAWRPDGWGAFVVSRARSRFRFPCRIALDEAKLATRFADRPSAIHEAVDDISIANRLFAMIRANSTPRTFADFTFIKRGRHRDGAIPARDRPRAENAATLSARADFEHRWARAFSRHVGGFRSRSAIRLGNP